MTPPLLWFDELDSTNAEARRRAEAGETGPVWIAARRQNAGRGRRGRSWISGEGDLATTLLTPCGLAPAEAAGVSFVAALAVYDLVAAYVPAERVALKWPNDVTIDGRKVAGVLVESGSRGEGLWLAVGIGVNLAAAPTQVERPATSLADHGAGAPPEAALEILAAAFARWQALWASAGLGPILDAWSLRAHGIPGPCTVRLSETVLSGRAEGLDSDGRLRLRLDDGSLRLISAGDVFFGGS